MNVLISNLNPGFIYLSTPPSGPVAEGPTRRVSMRGTADPRGWPKLFGACDLWCMEFYPSERL